MSRTLWCCQVIQRKLSTSLFIHTIVFSKGSLIFGLTIHRNSTTHTRRVESAPKPRWPLRQTRCSHATGLVAPQVTGSRCGSTGCITGLVTVSFTVYAAGCQSLRRACAQKTCTCGHWNVGVLRNMRPVDNITQKLTHFTGYSAEVVKVYLGSFIKMRNNCCDQWTVSGFDQQIASIIWNDLNSEPKY